MARKMRDAALDSREARRKLMVRGRPYWRAVGKGLHIGYRRLKTGDGTWWRRTFTGGAGDGAYALQAIGAADDTQDSNGVTVIDFWQAVERAREHVGKAGPLTVAQAIEAYLQFLDTNRKTGRDARWRAEALILPELGEVEVRALTADTIRKWHGALAKVPARLRTKPGEKQNHRESSDDGEAIRRRRSTANRTLTILKAALNRAWREKPEQIPSTGAWSRVEPFEGVDAARVRYLTVAEAQRLINASPPDFRSLVEAALQTGARFSELARLTVKDFNPDTGTVHVRTSKSGKGRHIVLTDEGANFFARACAGRASGDFILTKASGERWGKSNQARPIAEASVNAKIKPAINFHGLRHTYASLAIMSGAPIMVVARNLGHADTRTVERHYGHLAPSFIADSIRAHAPRFEIDNSNITPLYNTKP